MFHPMAGTVYVSMQVSNEINRCEIIVAGNVGLVMSVAKRYFSELRRSVDGGGSNGVGSILTMQDMIQEVNLLIRWKLRDATIWLRRKIVLILVILRRGRMNNTIINFVFNQDLL